MLTKRTIGLLGPQASGGDPDVGPSLKGFMDRACAPGGRVALVAAGWEEREAETRDLEEHLGCGVTNLGLWPLCEDAYGEDETLKGLMFRRYDTMQDLARLYRTRLRAELEPLREMVQEASGDAANGELYGPAVAHAFETLRSLDAHHVARVAALGDEVFEAAAERDVVKRGREHVARALEGTDTLLVAGGHVGILYNRMRMFGVLEALPPTASVLGWSAGAMVLTERILLFHDSPPQGSGDPELLGPGFGLAKGVVALPHANSRLRLDDPARVSLLARRFAPDIVVALDAGEGLVAEPGGEWDTSRAPRVLQPDGAVGLPEGASR